MQSIDVIIPNYNRTDTLDLAISSILIQGDLIAKIIIIDDDSIIYKKNSNVKILLKHTVYPEKLNQYLPFNIDNKTFFVHEGCGAVSERVIVININR